MAFLFSLMLFLFPICHSFVLFKPPVMTSQAISITSEDLEQRIRYQQRYLGELNTSYISGCSTKAHGWSRS
jgi:hypothetical protein